MIQHGHHSIMLLTFLAACAVTLAGCTSQEAKVDGTYRDSMGFVTIELKDGKATATVLGEKEKSDATYKVEGSIVTFTDETGSTRYQRNQDDSLTGPLGKKEEDQITLLKVK